MKRFIVCTAISLSVVFIMVLLLLNLMVDLNYRFNVIDGNIVGLAEYHDESYYKDNEVSSRSLVLNNGDSRSIYKFTDLGAEITISGYSCSKYTISTSNIKCSIDMSGAVENIRNLIEGVQEERVSGTAGHFDVVDGEIVIAGAEKGNLIDVDAVVAYICLRASIDDIVSVNLDDFLLEQDSETMEKSSELNSIMSKYDSIQIAYDCGFSIDKNMLYKYELLNVSDDNIEFVNDEDKVINMLVRNLVGYNSVGIDRQFTTHDKKSITVTGGTYGDYIDYSAEASEVIEMILSFDSDSERRPIMKQDAKFSLDTTYIEVDRTKQHVYYYEDGELVLDTDVVTGKPTPDRVTPSGVYFIINKTTDANLIGATWNVKSDRWMGVTYQGVGFHDASWRSSFGGEIYKSNGSHGCINTPKESMFKLYDMVEVGTPVVIY